MFNNYNYFPFQGFQPRLSLFTRLRGLNFGEILNSTQKTLNVVNQAIPIFYQIKPLWNNTKTIFRIANAINDDDKKMVTSSKTDDTSKEEKADVSTSTNNSNQPVFFI